MNTGHETSSDVDAVGSSVSDELAQLLAAPQDAQESHDVF